MRGGLRVSMNSVIGTCPSDRRVQLLTPPLTALMSGVRKARMRWSLRLYVLYVYITYGLKLVGWPPDMRFMNLSRITGLVRISRLVDLWESGEMYFAQVSDEEREAARENPLLAAPGPLHDGIRAKRYRKDVKRRRARPVSDPHGTGGRRKRTGEQKSAETVTEEMEAEVAEEEEREREEWPMLLYFSDEEEERSVRRAVRGYRIAKSLASDPFAEFR